MWKKSFEVRESIMCVAKEWQAKTYFYPKRLFTNLSAPSTYYELVLVLWTSRKGGKKREIWKKIEPKRGGW